MFDRFRKNCSSYSSDFHLGQNLVSVHDTARCHVNPRAYGWLWSGTVLAGCKIRGCPCSVLSRLLNPLWHFVFFPTGCTFVHFTKRRAKSDFSLQFYPTLSSNTITLTFFSIYLCVHQLANERFACWALTQLLILGLVCRTLTAHVELVELAELVNGEPLANSSWVNHAIWISGVNVDFWPSLC